MRTKIKRIRRITFLPAFILGVLLWGAGSLQAAHYDIFVQGLDPVFNHCNSNRNSNWGKQDVGTYWFGLVPDYTNNRIFVGFNTRATDGAFSNDACGAQSELTYAMNTFCKRGVHTCKIYTHSTGGLVMTYFLKKLQDISYWDRPKYGIQNIRLMANASGGSELAELTAYKWYNPFTSSGLKNVSGTSISGISTVQNSVRVTVARQRFDHNRTNGYALQLTSGTGKIAGFNFFMRGENDSVVSNHSLCGMRFVGNYQKCRDGTSTVQYDAHTLVCYTNYLFDSGDRYDCNALNENTWSSYRWAHKWDNHHVYAQSQNDSSNHLYAMLHYLEKNADRTAQYNEVVGTWANRRLHENHEGKWYNIPGKLKQISAGDGGEVWGVNSANNIYRYNGNHGWTQIAGQLKHVSVGQNGVVWGVNSNDDVFRYNGNNTWTQIAGKLKQVDVGPLGEVWGVNSSNNIYRYNGNNTWTQVTGASLKYVSVGESGVVFGVAPDGRIYRSNSTNTWALIAGNLKQIDFGPNQNDGVDLGIWGVNYQDQIFRYNGGGTWTQIPGGLKHVSVGAHGYRWGVSSSDDIFYLVAD